MEGRVRGAPLVTVGRAVRGGRGGRAGRGRGGDGRGLEKLSIRDMRDLRDVLRPPGYTYISACGQVVSVHACSSPLLGSFLHIGEHATCRVSKKERRRREVLFPEELLVRKVHVRGTGQIHFLLREVVEDTCEECLLEQE